MRPQTILTRVRGLAIGNPDRFKDSPVYDEVKSLPYTKGPGLVLDAHGKYQWQGSSGDTYRGIFHELKREAGLSDEEAQTLWSFLDWKRRTVWYIHDDEHPVTHRPIRSEASKKDEEECKELVSFDWNNLTVVIKNGYKLEHFMAIHYGTNWFTYKIWGPHVEWRAKQTASALVGVGIPTEHTPWLTT